MIEWPIYRNFSVFSQNSGYFDQNEKGVKKCPFPQSLRFCHNWWASGGVPGVRYAEKLSALFYLHWESLWPGVNDINFKDFVKLRQGSGKDRQGMALKAKGLKAYLNF